MGKGRERGKKRATIKTKKEKWKKKKKKRNVKKRRIKDLFQLKNKFEEAKKEKRMEKKGQWGGDCLPDVGVLWTHSDMANHIY